MKKKKHNKNLHHGACTKVILTKKAECGRERGHAAINYQGARISTMMLKSTLCYTKKYHLHEAHATTSLICPNVRMSVRVDSIGLQCLVETN